MKLSKIAIILVLILSLCTPVYADSSNVGPALLSDMSEEECVEFIVAHGVEIPEEYEEDTNLGSFVRSVILAVEEDPYIMFVVGDSEVAAFSNAIKAAVNSYYGTGESPIGRNSTYVLQYSTPVGNWKSSYMNYNCYAYALGETGQSYHPGQICGQYYSKYQTVDKWAELTEADLIDLGYDCVVTETSYSNIMALSSTHSIICLRKCSAGGKEDFHYMKYIYGEWRHKPGQTQVLRFNYLPYERNWTNEHTYVYDNVLYTGAGDRSYTGTIYYFAYRGAHTYNESYTGENYHSGSLHYYQHQFVCADCGDTYYTWNSVSCGGPPCPNYAPFAIGEIALESE